MTGPEGILLVRHSYMPGLHLPGGGVEPGESFEDALAKELREEASVRLTARPELFGLYLNRNSSNRDHVALYVCRAFERGEFEPTREIVESRFFAPEALPEDVTGGTRRRIAEVLEGRAPDMVW